MNITTAPKFARRYPAVVGWSDTQLGDRIRHLHRGLTTLADRHAEFVEGLRPIAPETWTDAQIL